MKLKHLLSIEDLSNKEIEDLIKLTYEVKKYPSKFRNKLSGKTVALFFDKPSTRTRLSFQAAVHQLGGNTVFLRRDEIQLKRGETIDDTAKMLSLYVNAVVVRTFLHDDILTFAKNSNIPVINGLTDAEHPCQALSDIFTIKEKKGEIKKLKIVFVGDGNNVVNSLMLLCSKLGLELWISTPKNYKPEKEVFSNSLKYAKQNGGKIIYEPSPQEAVKNADVIYTDVWTSMGMEDEAEIRRKEFKNFVVNKDLIKYAKKDVIVMHCLPAHRGEEITSEILDGPNSVVIEQARNRLFLQKALLLMMI